MAQSREATHGNAFDQLLAAEAAQRALERVLALDLDIAVSAEQKDGRGAGMAGEML